MFFPTGQVIAKVTTKIKPILGIFYLLNWLSQNIFKHKWLTVLLELKN